MASNVTIGSTASINLIATIPFLSFPFDIITTIVGFASNETLISYSQTCHFLRLCSCRIYLYRIGIIKSKDRYMRVNLSQEFPPIAIQILTSFPPMRTFEAIHLNCDFLILRHFYWEICEFIRACNVTCLYLHHHSDERTILGESTTAFALSAVLGTIQAPLASVAILHGFRPSRNVLAPYSPTYLQRRKSWPCKVDQHLFHATFMDTLRYLKLDSALFPTPELYSIYSKLLTGAALCSLDFTCNDLDLYQDFVQRAHFPNLQVLHVTVRSSPSLYLDEQFLHRHPRLSVVWLLNNPNHAHSNGPRPVDTAPKLKLPDVGYARIAANYLGWEMQDTSSLSTLEIQVVSPFMPPRTGTFCQEVKSLCGIMVASNHTRFQDDFVLGIEFPERFATHLLLSESPMTKAFKCECTLRDSTIDNVGSLKLTFERLDNNVVVSATFLFLEIASLTI
ncbi:hypothetical protein GALMADRAFT_142780 [Galerina marginata CBS 339.88]|uniref:F-box domain-containing protein n=1 Tax=Galerina marginata (strain CBS 339.88) TaxID=685588 RepID=A0A067SQ73_GALM3|nr:hypothetical protein GALMADRAFT_142780 [Galerina marginata CBS 339.88]